MPVVSHSNNAEIALHLQGTTNIGHMKTGAMYSLQTSPDFESISFAEFSRVVNASIKAVPILAMMSISSAEELKTRIREAATTVTEDMLKRTDCDRFPGVRLTRTQFVCGNTVYPLDYGLLKMPTVVNLLLSPNRSSNFNEWFEECLLKRLEEPNVIIMDNVPYHSRIVNPVHTTKSTIDVVHTCGVTVSASDRETRKKSNGDRSGERAGHCTWIVASIVVVICLRIKTANTQHKTCTDVNRFSFCYIYFRAEILRYHMTKARIQSDIGIGIPCGSVDRASASTVELKTRVGIPMRERIFLRSTDPSSYDNAEFLHGNIVCTSVHRNNMICVYNHLVI
ncbi:hypothetical protein ANN_24489 [Periplaneta americana]|uniref:Uncharacterized protein n=1 Tax=Periplaneta americana TaxID=6978 RepID=A0ABQ8S3I7_PERAM|nr:hypothetical protein ANN_24489 [Periplaneta americana]